MFLESKKRDGAVSVEPKGSSDEVFQVKSGDSIHSVRGKHELNHSKKSSASRSDTSPEPVKTNDTDISNKPISVVFNELLMSMSMSMSNVNLYSAVNST